ncbi:TonB-dependent receptor plug domain-containing protein [Novosphingobium terrae]|uniref:TonB-dependent receptor plug domain-containing protein n=1 Tax=Novosphingobium terrae TaxID=2726189 RepID=UPI00197E6E03|nr:TonB-dependent receptor [Novosphingobium terrae]
MSSSSFTARPFAGAWAGRHIWLKSSFLIGAGVFALAAGAAHAEDAPAPTPATSDPAAVEGNGETIVVTGSHGAARAAEKSLVPISVASLDDLARSGKQNLRDALAEVLPSYQVQAGGYQGQQGAGVRGARLRGLDAKDTLILVNGVRRHTSSLLVGGASPTDLDLIPSNAIERIEVLGDGAASLYGSDAIAGVINIILKKTAQTGGGFSVYYGKYGQSVGDQSDLYGTTKNVQFHQGFKLDDAGSFINFSANAQLQDGTNIYPGYKAANINDKTTLLYPLQADGTLDPRETSQSRYRQWLGLPSSKTYSFAYNTEIALNSDLTFYSNATYAWRYSSGPGYFRTASNQSVAASTTPSPQDPFANAPYTSGAQIFPDGYLPTFDDKENDFQFVAGLKGTASGWDWNLSSGYGSDHAQVYTKNSINVSAGPAYWSQRDFYDGAQTDGQLLTTLAASKKFDHGLFGRALTVSAGVEHRYDRFTKTAGEYLSYYAGPWVWPSGTGNAGVHPNLGAQGMSGNTPDSAGAWSRNNIAAYVELNQQLTDAWTVDLAGRYEYFTDFGSAPSGQISTRYEFSPAFAIRGSFGNGFSAPTLLQEHNATQAGSYSVDSNPQNATYGQYIQQYTVTTNAYQATGKATGIQQLKPEHSINASAGLVIKPFAHTTLTLDGYLIDIRNRIVSATANVTNGSALYNLLINQGIYNVTSIAFNLNGAHTFTKGFDLRLEHSDDLGKAGTLHWTLASNENVTTVKNYSPLPAVLGTASAGTLRVLQGQFTSYYPKNITSLALRWEVGKLNAWVKQTHWSSTTYLGTTAALDQHQSPAFTTDASLSYDLTPQIRFTVGGNNVFNKRPDRLSSAAQALQFISATAVAPYNSYAPFGLDGGYYYGRADFKW